MMLFYRYTTRPARYAAVLAHTIREAIDNTTVDLSGVEETLADKLALSEKIDTLQARIEAYEESIEESTNTKTKPKAKRKPRAKKT